MTGYRPVVAVIASATGGVETLCTDFVEPALSHGWQLVITLTPTAGRRLESSGERARLEEATGFSVRVDPRMPGERSPHPAANCVVVAPASANTVAKIALGIADNQALTMAVETLGEGQVPMVVFPRVNAAHVRHPAWSSHIAALQRAGAHVIQGPDVWPLYEPREAPPDRRLPWPRILDVTHGLLDRP